MNPELALFKTELALDKNRRDLDYALPGSDSSHEAGSVELEEFATRMHLLQPGRVVLRRVVAGRSR